jgi:GAF domain-containing protein
MTQSLSTARTRLNKSQSPIFSRRERLLQRLSQRIERFTSKLLYITKIAKDICNEVRTQLEFDLAAIQLIDFEEQVIQTINGSGLSGEWHKIAKHSLEGAPKFWDIQADIALACPPRLEVITGWDPRFDEFIYKESGHSHYTRAWVPLIVVRDTKGHLIEARPEQFSFEPIACGQSRRVIELAPRAPFMATKRSFEVIGTLEAGFDNSGYTHGRDISDDLARRLFERACQSAAILYQATLFHVLELVTESVKQITHADCATSHFPLSTYRHRFAYNVWLGPPHARELTPRKGGLGELAIKAEKPRSVLYERTTSKRFNPAVYTAGIKAYAAFPLMFRGRLRPLDATNPGDGDASLKGVLYIAFRQPRRFTKSEIDSLQLFIALAVEAIRNVTYHMQALHSVRQLANLHDIARLFAGETDTQHLLRNIAGNSLNILAADLVIIYRYDAAQHCFLTGEAAAGRRENPNSGPGGLEDNYTPPLRLVAQGKSIYAESREQTIALYCDKGQQGTVTRFVEEEGIKSAAAVLLRLREEVVGVLFVNHRHVHIFSTYERSFIETLASTAAIAISNRRLQFEADQAHAKAMREVCGVILHELSPKIGVLELRATKEVPNYETGGVKVRLERIKRLIIAIRGLYRAAAATSQRREFDLAELVRAIADEEDERKDLDISLRGPKSFSTQRL